MRYFCGFPLHRPVSASPLALRVLPTALRADGPCGRGELADVGLPFVMALRPHQETWAASPREISWQPGSALGAPTKEIWPESPLPESESSSPPATCSSLQTAGSSRAGTTLTTLACFSNWERSRQRKGRSRCSSGPWPTGSGCWAPTTPTPGLAEQRCQRLPGCGPGPGRAVPAPLVAPGAQDVFLISPADAGPSVRECRSGRELLLATARLLCLAGRRRSASQRRF